MGKNFSTNNANGKRRKADFYETPYSITRQFLEKEQVEKSVSFFDPACGDGAILRVLSEMGYTNSGDDLASGYDFLLSDKIHNYILNNPPYSKAFAFIQKAKQVTDRFAFLLPLSYLHGKERYDYVWTDKKFPLRKVYVFTRYPMLGLPLRKDGKYPTGMMVYAWFLWEKYSKNNFPEIDWIDNDDYVIRSNK